MIVDLHQVDQPGLHEEDGEEWLLLEAYRDCSHYFERKHRLAVGEIQQLMARNAMLWRIIEEDRDTIASLRHQIVSLRRKMTI